VQNIISEETLTAHVFVHIGQDSKCVKITRMWDCPVLEMTVVASESCSARRAPSMFASRQSDQDHPLAQARSWQWPRYINCVCDMLRLFEDPSVENLPPAFLPFAQPPRLVRFSYSRSRFFSLSLATRAHHIRLTRSRTASPPTPITKLFLGTTSSHGCPQVLSMDVRALSGHLAAHCREPHS
jgi:hypothetical protein